MTDKAITLPIIKEYECVDFGAVSPDYIDNLVRTIEKGWQARPRPGENESEKSVAARLGLHISDGENGKFRVGDYVGLVWWPGHEGRVALRVKPKFKNMDYMTMYVECMRDPQVSQQLDNCFFFWPEKPLIEVSHREIPLQDSGIPFIAISYVKELHKMIRRNMRRNFIRKEDNLTGRMKGKLMPNKHLRRNVFRGRPERNYCQYSVIDEDCIENQILLTALERSARYLMNNKQTRNNKHLRRIIRECRNALSGVTYRPNIHDREFSGIRYTGTFVHYKRPHAFARIVLNQRELDPSYSVRKGKNGHSDNDSVKVIPFALCTSELFERYTELKVREVAREIEKQKNITDITIRQDNGMNIAGEIPAKFGNSKDQEINVRPDFLLKSEKGSFALILDSKYKAKYKKRINHRDFRQLTLYASHLGVLNELGLVDDYILDIEKSFSAVLVYPSLEKDNDDLKDFLIKLVEPKNSVFDFLVYDLKCPTISERL